MPPASEIAIIGTGRVAQAMGRALREAGLPVAWVAGRSPSRTAEAARFVGGDSAALSIHQAAQHAGTVLIAVSDAAIEPVARELAAAGGAIRVALHTCGNAGPEPLAALAKRGASCGVIHPLQTIFDADQGAVALRGVFFAFSGDAAAARCAEEIASRLGGRLLCVAPEARPLYHSAAVMASNYITVLLDAAVEAMSLAGIPPDTALQAIMPLARTAVENAAKAGPLHALTGPIARGDVPTVAAHLRVLSAAEGSLPDLYRAAGLRALRMACRRGLSEEACTSLEALLIEKAEPRP